MGDITCKAPLVSFHEYWAIPENFQAGGLRRYIYTFLKKPTEIFRFVPLPIENKLSPLRILQNCVTLLWRKIQGQKPRPMEIPHEFLMSTPGNSTSFLTICLPGDTGVPELQYSSFNSAVTF